MKHIAPKVTLEKSPGFPQSSKLTLPALCVILQGFKERKNLKAHSKEFQLINFCLSRKSQVDSVFAHLSSAQVFFILLQNWVLDGRALVSSLQTWGFSYGYFIRKRFLS